MTRSFLMRETGADLLPWPEVGTADGSELALRRARGGASIPRAAAGSRWSRARPGCRSCAARSTRSSRRCRPGFVCRSLIPIVDRIDTWRHGAVALWLDPDGITIESANDSRGDRPWVPHPVSARERARRAKPEPRPDANQEEPPAPEPRENE